MPAKHNKAKAIKPKSNVSESVSVVCPDDKHEENSEEDSVADAAEPSGEHLTTQQYNTLINKLDQVITRLDNIDSSVREMNNKITALENSVTRHDDIFCEQESRFNIL